MKADLWVIDLDALGELAQPLYLLKLVLINLLGSERLNLLWLAALLAMLVLVASLDRVFDTPSSGARQRFNRRAFMQDLLLFFVQVGLARLLPLLAFFPAVALLSSQLAAALRAGLQLRLAIEGPDWLLAGVFVALAYAAQDLARYVGHRLQHRIDWLWALHKFHHSAESLCPMTVFREHPLILVINGYLVALATMSVSILVLVLCPQLAGQPVELLGGLLAFMLIKTQVLLAHFHRPISLGWLDRWLITPAVHALHHSQDVRHLNRNFGTTLTWWDRLFGTYHAPVKQELLQLRYGVDETPARVAGRLLPLGYLYGTLTLDAARLLLRRLFRTGRRHRV